MLPSKNAALGKKTLGYHHVWAGPCTPLVEPWPNLKGTAPSSLVSIPPPEMDNSWSLNQSAIVNLLGLIKQNGSKGVQSVLIPTSHHRIFLNVWGCWSKPVGPETFGDRSAVAMSKLYHPSIQVLQPQPMGCYWQLAKVNSNTQWLNTNVITIKHVIIVGYCYDNALLVIQLFLPVSSKGMHCNLTPTVSTKGPCQGYLTKAYFTNSIQHHLAIERL